MMFLLKKAVSKNKNKSKMRYQRIVTQRNKEINCVHV